MSACALILFVASVAFAATGTAVIQWTNTSSTFPLHLERASSAAGPWTQIADIPASTSTYTDNNLVIPGTVCYRLAYYNAGGNGPYSIVDANSCKTFVSPPTMAPGGVTIIINITNP